MSVPHLLSALMGPVLGPDLTPYTLLRLGVVLIGATPHNKTVCASVHSCRKWWCHLHYIPSHVMGLIPVFVIFFFFMPVKTWKLSALQQACDAFTSPLWIKGFKVLSHMQGDFECGRRARHFFLSYFFSSWKEILWYIDLISQNTWTHKSVQSVPKVSCRNSTTD